METKILKKRDEIMNFLEGGISENNMNAFLSMKGIERWKRQVFNVCWDSKPNGGFVEILSIPNLDQKAGVFSLLEEKAEIDKTKSRYRIKISEIEEIVLEIG